jgi:hypothetical protein
MAAEVKKVVLEQHNSTNGITLPHGGMAMADQVLGPTVSRVLEVLEEIKEAIL